MTGEEIGSETEIHKFLKEIFDDSEKIVLHTSGSTSKPKPFTFSKSALIKSSMATNSFFGLDKTSIALLGLPVNYIAGKMMVVRALIGGYNLLIVRPSSNPLSSLSEEVTFVPLTPFQARSILRTSPEDFQKVEIILIGGGALDANLRKELARLPNEVYASFGMTETLTHFAIARIEPKDDLLFKPLPGVELKTDERGCLIVSREGITDQPLVTNDLVELKEEGFRWLGRADNLINSGGIKVIPEEVESLLAGRINSPFFVAGIPDENLGEQVVLFIEGDQSPDLKGIIFGNPYQKPRLIVQISRFEYTDSGKIKRRSTVEAWLSAR